MIRIFFLDHFSFFLIFFILSFFEIWIRSFDLIWITKKNFLILQALIDNATKFKILDKTDNAQINPVAFKLIMEYGSLPLLEPHRIKEAFDILVAITRCKYDWIHPLTLEIHTNKRWERFIKYFIYQWFKREGPGKITISEEEQRTTNALESYHKQLKKDLESEKRSYFS